MAKAALWTATDAEERKLGEQTGLDTLVVLAINDADQRWGVGKERKEGPRLGSTVARLKLKGIDGGPHKRWSMWFNSTQREQPYPGLNCTGPADESRPSRKGLV